MSYVVFARKYRPEDFDGIVGQEHVATTLTNAITQDRVAHAYLFAGPRGVGKTTAARILAKALNCEKGPAPKPCSKCVSCREIATGMSMDVLEIDGASNRGIDEVRSLRENVKFSPAHGRYKVYIIDEVHMLTQEAFNALLKTLEEPPPHVKFIFATTHPHKVPATVSSRCQRFDFRRISLAQIVAKLKEIAKAESIKADEEAVFSIARQADGSLRDAESILDQLNTFCAGDIRKDDIARILGTVSDELLEEFFDIIIKKDVSGALTFTDRMIKEGKDLSFFLSGLLDYIRDIIVAKGCNDPAGIIDAAERTLEAIIRQAGEFTQEELFYISAVLLNAHESMKRAASVRVVFEMAVVRIASRASLAPLREIMDKVEALERKIEAHAAPPRQNSAAPAVRPAPAQVNSGDTILNSPAANELSTVSPEFRPVTLSDVQQAWPAFLNVLKSRKMSAASYLLEGSIHSCEGGVLTIAFPKNYTLHKEALERPDNKLIVENTLEGVLGRKVRIAFTTHDVKREDAAAGSPSASSGFAARRAPRGERAGPDDPPRQELLKEPIVQSALEAFDGRIVRRSSGHT